MATKRPTTASDGDGFPAAPDFSRDDRGRIYAESVISSRLSDDGGEAGEQRPKSMTSKKSGASRPETSKSKRSNKSRSARKSSKDASAATGAPASHRLSGTGEPATRTRNLASRSSHVPSLTSNAFFRPMSSQKLQAHRGASRPTTTQQQQQQNRLSLGQQQHSALDDGATDIGGSVLRHNEPTAAALEDYSMGVPPSRGTEGTEQDRVTSNTSPTGGHYPTGSLSDSVRPLHQSPEVNRNNLSVNVGKTYQDIGRTIPSPVKSPRSFRSSFLLPGRESGQGQNRNTEGAEKLSSGASSPKLAPRDQSTQHRPAPQPNDAKPGHVYQYFEGNTRFWLGGRWQNTKGKPINIATGVFILLLCVLFLAFSAPWLWHNVSPALPITFAYLSFVCMSSFIHASVSDPGILPRSLHQFPPIDEHDDPLRLGPPTSDWTPIKSSDPRTAAMEIPVKHCRTCNIWRPPRAHHCRLCDNCIEGHDHHCVWINNCVGKRNYRYFFTMLTSGTILCIYGIVCSMVQIFGYKNRNGIGFGQAIDHFPVPFALFILCFIALCYPAALMGYHVFLMARGETTREYMNSHKFAKKERFRPYSQSSIWRNFVAVLCRPRAPTYYQFKSSYKQGDQRLGIHRDLRPKETPQGLEMQNVPGSGRFKGPTALRNENR